MAVDVRIIPIKEFLRSDVSGNLDLERSLIILLNLVEECKNHNVDRILIDTREATSNCQHAGCVDSGKEADILGAQGTGSSGE